MAELTTITKVKRMLGIDEDDVSQDAELSDCIDAAENMAREICNRPDGWTTATHTELFDGESSGTLILTYTPVDTDVGVTLTIDGSTLDSTLFAVEAATGIVRLKRPTFATGYDLGYSLGYRQTFGNDFQNVQAVYSGGYAAASMPAGLSRVVTAMAASLFREKDADPTVKSETLGDYSVTNADGSASEGFGGDWSSRLAPWIRRNT